MSTATEALVIGGGFYGCAIAIHLAKNSHIKSIRLIEQEADLFAHASAHNQARVHNGYHYPRSFTTAYRSRMNFPRFLSDWPEAIDQSFKKIYAIGKKNSKVTAQQFTHFCKQIGASLAPAPAAITQLFSPNYIAGVFLAQEYGFNAQALAQWAKAEIAACGIDLQCNATATAITKTPAGLALHYRNSAGQTVITPCRYIFNCSYSGLNQLSGDFPGSRAGLRHEIVEIALIKAAPCLAGLGITLMDGPFFSTMPFPSHHGLHSLSHVRYSPHRTWLDNAECNPYSQLQTHPPVSRADRMLRDAARYVPAMSQAQPVRSIFEVKSILLKNETDDGRPILFERYPELPGLFSVLGSKIDNIYDVLERINAECLA